MSSRFFSSPKSKISKLKIMSLTRNETQQPRTPSIGPNENGVAVLPSMAMMHWLRLNSNTVNKLESYEGLQLGFSPFMFSSLECYLPPLMLSLSRVSKLHYMCNINLRYSFEGECTWFQRHREYKGSYIWNSLAIDLSFHKHFLAWIASKIASSC